MSFTRRCLSLILVLFLDGSATLAASSKTLDPTPEVPAEMNTVYPLALGYRNSIFKEITLPPLLPNCLSPADRVGSVEHSNRVEDDWPTEQGGTRMLYALMSLQR